MKKEMNRIRKKQNILWYIAIVLEWIAIPLYLAAIGYEFDIHIYTILRNWKYVISVYYVIACIDIALFGYFVLLYKKKDNLKLMVVSVFCCLMQIVLLISKVKF